MRWFSARVPEGFVALNNIADNPGATKAVRVCLLAMGRLAGYPRSPRDCHYFPCIMRTSPSS